MLNHTWLGRAIRASAVNPQGAELVGVNVGAVAALTFAIGVASVGRGGLDRRASSTPSCRARTTSGSPACSGSSCWAASAACRAPRWARCCSGVAETMTVTYISPAWATAVPYVFIIIVLLLRPQGLMGPKLREDVAAA